MKKLVAFLPLLVILVFCAPFVLADDYGYGDDPAITADLVMWTWDDTTVKVNLPYIQETFPGLNVTAESVASADYLTKVQTTISTGGELPDLLVSDGNWRGTMYELGVYDRLDAEPYNLDLSLIEEYALPLMKNSKGEIMGFISTASPAGLGYNVKLAEEYLGTSDPAELEAMFPTWEAFIEKGVEVKEKSNGTVYMLAGLDDAFTVIGGQNDQPYVVDGKLNLDASLGRTFELMIQMRDAGIVDALTQYSPAWCASYSQSTCIFYPCATWSVKWNFQSNDPQGTGNWKVMLPPEGGFNWGGGTIGICSQSKNKEAAWAYLKKSILDVECNKRTNAATGWYTTNKAAYKEPELAHSYSEYFCNMDMTDFFVNRCMPTIVIRTPSQYDNPIEEACALVRLQISGDPAFGYDSAMAMLAEEISYKLPDIAQ